jgi:hypothetical protein
LASWWATEETVAVSAAWGAAGAAGAEPELDTEPEALLRPLPVTSDVDGP